MKKSIKRIAKKYLSLLIISSCIISFSACASKNESAKNLTTPDNTINNETNTSLPVTKIDTGNTLTNKDFSVNYKEVEITLDSSVEELLKILGNGTANEDNNFGFVGWDKDKKYKYHNHGYPENSPTFYIMTRTDVKSGNVILNEIDITILGSNREIKKDDSYDKMLETYGEPSEKLELQDNSINYLYILENKALIFNVNKETNNIVKISIRPTPFTEVLQTK